MGQAGSGKSWLAYYVFDPVKAELAKLAGSSNAGVAAAGQAASTALTSTAQAVGADLSAGLTANSATAAGNDIITGLENGLNASVAAFVDASVPFGLGPEASAGAVALLQFGESHAVAYVQSLFAHAKTQVAAATAAPATAAVSTPVAAKAA